ncbi:MAG: type I 3-dehydroquinate dehydratase [Eubacterium sp.]|nr:type I 3-dehydroquinate dehydratase [Eubacterium sp.]
MEYTCNNMVNLRGVDFGGGTFRRIVSIVPEVKTEAVQQLAQALAGPADAVEVCTRNYGSLSELADVLETAECVENRTRPLILNLNETGRDQVHLEAERAVLALTCVQKKLVDAVDISIEDPELLRKVCDETAGADLCRITSVRVYAGIGSEDKAARQIIAMEETGADLIKAEYLANDDVDLIKAARVSERLKEESLISHPVCISMLGDVGLMQRVLADRCGCDFGYTVLAAGAEGMLLETEEQNRIMRELFYRED